MKKNKIKYLASTFAVSLVIAAIAVICAFIENLGDSSVPVGVLDEQKNKDIYIIDPGHGGFDGGAVGQTGVLEKDINLDIAIHLQELFSMSGIEAFLTRTTDVLLYNENDGRSKKAQDVRNRVSFTKSFVNPVFVSIHQNKFPVSKYSGLQVYYSPHNSSSKLLAESIQSEVKSKLQNDNNREVKKSGSTIFVLKNLDCPAVLVECGFLSNPKEEALLSDCKYRKKLALCIFSALMNYEDMKNTRKEIS